MDINVTSTLLFNMSLSDNSTTVASSTSTLFTTSTETFSTSTTNRPISSSISSITDVTTTQTTIISSIFPTLNDITINTTSFNQTIADRDSEDLSQIVYIIFVLGIYLSVIMSIVCLHIRRRDGDRYWTLEDEYQEEYMTYRNRGLAERVRLLKSRVESMTGIKDAHLIDKVAQNTEMV